MIGGPVSLVCGNCDATLRAHTTDGRTYYTGEDGRSLCPDPTDLLWLGHEPEHDQDHRQAA